MAVPVPILFTIPNFISAGSGQCLVNILERLDRKRFAPGVCVLRKGGALDKRVAKLADPFLEASFTLPARPYLSLPLRAWRAARVFRPYRFKVWHSLHYLDDYTEPLVARLSGAKGWIYIKNNMSWRGRAWKLRSLLASRIAAQNTDMLGAFFSSPFFSGKALYLPPGVDLDEYRPGVEKRCGLRRERGIPDSAPLIACVAQLIPVKGHPTLLRALARVPGAQLLVAGRAQDAAYAASLRALAAELGVAGRTHFLDWISDVPALLAEADICVLPTWGKGRMEGCPVALLEAMACAKPCVATDIPGPRDVIRHGRDGFLFPSEDHEALARTLNELAGSQRLRRETGEAARERIRERFSIQAEVAAYASIYEEVSGA